MKTPIEVLLSVADIGGKLGIVEGVAVRTLLPPGCHTALKAAIREHKVALLELLRLNFLVVRSDTIKETVIWAADEETKERLVAAGATQGSIYTPSELEALVHQRITVAELPVIHASKRTFNGRLRNP